MEWTCSCDMEKNYVGATPLKASTWKTVSVVGRHHHHESSGSENGRCIELPQDLVR
jgi:hypothetical protein